MFSISSIVSKSPKHFTFILLLLPLILLHQHHPFADAQSSHDSCILDCTRVQRTCVAACSVNNSTDREKQWSCSVRCGLSMTSCFVRCDRNSPCLANTRRCEPLSCNRACRQNQALPDQSPQLTECFTECSERWISCMTNGCIDDSAAYYSKNVAELVDTNRLNYVEKAMI